MPPPAEPETSGNKEAQGRVEGGVRTTVVILQSVAMLALAGCGGTDETSFESKRVSNEQALRLIRSCEVTRFLTLHSGEVDVTLEGGRRVFVTRPDVTALSKAAVNASLERGCEIAVGTE
jgi:hypothetical protein